MQAERGTAVAYVDATLETRRAEQAARAGRTQEAVASLWRILSASAVDNDAHKNAALMLARVLEDDPHPGTRRVVVLACWYARMFERAKQLAAEEPLDLAHAYYAAGNTSAAANAYEQHGWMGHAALAAEQAGDFVSAERLWTSFLAHGSVREATYETGLARYNRARALEKLGEHAAARQEAIRSIQLLEMAADVFETHGERERAFDCFSVLMKVGDGGAFENLAEGYLNSIRVLTADNLQNYVIQYYDDFFKQAISQNEFAAASSVARDAANYCAQHSLPYAAHYRRQAAKAHVANAEHLWQTTRHASMVENAYAAAIDDYLALGLFAQIASIYTRLAALPLPEARKARYQGLAKRVSHEKDREPQFFSFPDHLRSQMAYPDIWRSDIREYEEGGDPAEAMIGVLLDAAWPAYTHSRALACALFSLHPQLWMERGDPNVQIAELLGRTEIYAALAPLESLALHPNPNVRGAVMRACASLYFKRTFRTLKRGVRDANVAVRTAAMQTVSQLYFPHALDPLQQIFDETEDDAVRRAALSAIGQIGTPDAKAVLADIARHGTRIERRDAQKFLRDQRT